MLTTNHFNLDSSQNLRLGKGEMGALFVTIDVPTSPLAIILTSFMDLSNYRVWKNLYPIELQFGSILSSSIRISAVNQQSQLTIYGYRK